MATVACRLRRGHGARHLYTVFGGERQYQVAKLATMAAVLSWFETYHFGKMLEAEGSIVGREPAHQRAQRLTDACVVLQIQRSCGAAPASTPAVTGRG